VSSSRKQQRALTGIAASEARELRRVNASSLGERTSFAGHRAQLTEIACAAAAGRERPARICVLGAGNCNDLDLARLAEHYAEIHLVDLDLDALAGAAGRAEKQTRMHLRCHAPVDLSGILGKLEAWRAMKVTPEELMACPDVASRGIAAALPAPFDVVLSACLLTQLQLSVLRVLTDQHPLFEAVRQIVNLIHFRSLMWLLAPGGRGIFVTDATSDSICGRTRLEQGAADPLTLLSELAAEGQLFHAVEPGSIALTCSEDPVLSRGLRVDPPFAAWLWQNGPARTFLTYGLVCERLA